MLLSLLNSARLRPELLILVLMVMIISMFVIPLPTYLVDFLIALNIVLAILVFMGSFYIDRILSFFNVSCGTVNYHALSSGIIDQYQPSYLD